MESRWCAIASFSRILPELSGRGIFTMVVTSGIIPIPVEWIGLPRFTVAVSIDGLPEHHNVRRHPATYERILSNLAGRLVNVHWTITAQMLARDGYMEEYVRFWNARSEVRNIWVSLYSPQRGEQSAERLTPRAARAVARELPRLRALYPKLLTPEGYAQALLHPPASPRECGFSRLSKNFSADLKTHVEPCVFGGDPDCSQCGCSASAATHWISGMRIAGPLKARHLLHGSMRIGSAMARLQNVALPAWREREQLPSGAGNRIWCRSRHLNRSSFADSLARLLPDSLPYRRHHRAHRQNHADHRQRHRDRHLDPSRSQHLERRKGQNRAQARSAGIRKRSSIAASAK